VVRANGIASKGVAQTPAPGRRQRSEPGQVEAIVLPAAGEQVDSLVLSLRDNRTRLGSAWRMVNGDPAAVWPGVLAHAPPVS